MSKKDKKKKKEKKKATKAKMKMLRDTARRLLDEAGVSRVAAECPICHQTVLTAFGRILPHDAYLMPGMYPCSGSGAQVSRDVWSPESLDTDSLEDEKPEAGPVC